MLKDLAEASRKEPATSASTSSSTRCAPTISRSSKVWRDQKALDAHVAAAHTKQYRDTLQPMTGSPLDERVYKAID